MRTTTVQFPGVGETFEVGVHHNGDRHISESIMMRGDWEPLETAVISRLVNAQDLVVDAGANLGWYTLLAAASGATVVAFEPMPANAMLLRSNVDRNGFAALVEIHESALGQAAGEAVLSLSIDNQGDHRLVTASGSRSTVSVKVQSLDDVLDGRRPTLVKLDTNAPRSPS